MKAPGYVSEGDEVQQVIMQVALAANKRGIYVYDRGGDGDVMFAFFLENALDFIVRLVGDRYLIDWGTRKVLARDLAARAVDALRRREIRAKPRGALRPFGRGSENWGNSSSRFS